MAAHANGVYCAHVCVRLVLGKIGRPGRASQWQCSRFCRMMLIDPETARPPADAEALNREC